MQAAKTHQARVEASVDLLDEGFAFIVGGAIVVCGGRSLRLWHSKILQQRRYGSLILSHTMQEHNNYMYYCDLRYIIIMYSAPQYYMYNNYNIHVPIYICKTY